MQLKRLGVVVTMLVCGLCLSQVWATSLGPYPPGFNISNVTDDSELVFVGTVTHTEFVYRAETRYKLTTDITVAVEDMIRGEPNNGENSVKFMARGGAGFDELTNRRRKLIVVGAPKFEVGDRGLFFLNKITRANANIPHGGYLTFRYSYGKREIEDNHVQLLYTLDDDSRRNVKMPVDLAALIGKAAVKDKDATLLLESDIKSAIRGQTGLATLTATLVDTLKIEAQDIVDSDDK